MRKSSRRERYCRANVAGLARVRVRGRGRRWRASRGGDVRCLWPRRRRPRPGDRRLRARGGGPGRPHRRRHRRAAELYRQALDDDGGNEIALYNLGLIAQADGKARQAERRYRAAIQADPDFTPALFNLAILRTGDRAYDEAADLYRQVVAIDPGNASAHLNLGFLLRDDLGRAAEGQAELDLAVELDPSLQDRLPAPAGAGGAA